MKSNYILFIFCVSIKYFYLAQNNIDNWIWAKNYGGNNADMIKLIASDGNNIYSVGYYTQQINFDNQIVFNSSTSYRNYFILKTNGAGNVIWAKEIQSASGNTSGEAVCIDKNKNIIAGGVTSGSVIVIDSQTLTNPNYSFNMSFVIKYDTSGNVMWAKKIINSSGQQNLSHIVCDENNNIFITGNYMGKYLIIDNDTLVNSDTTGSTYDGYLIKLSSAGNVLWKKNISVNSGYNDAPNGLVYSNGHLFALFTATSSSGNVSQLYYINPITSAIIWTKNIYNHSFLGKNTIAFQKNNNRVIVIGNYYSTGTTLENYIISEPFVAYIDINGNIQNIDALFHNLYPNVIINFNLIKINGIYTNNNDDIYLTGTVTNSVMAVKNLSITAVSDWISVLNDNMNFAYWLCGIKGGPSPNYINSVAIDNAGNVYTGGILSTGTSKSFGSINITKSNAADAFLAKIDGLTSLFDINPSTLSHLKIYPNPNNGNFFIQSKYSTDIEIYNIIGQKILDKKILSSLQNEVSLQNSGLYLILDKQTHQTYKIIIDNK